MIALKNVFIIFLIPLKISSLSAQEPTAKVLTDQHINVVSEKFLSYSIDPKLVLVRNDLLLNNYGLCMAKSLSPAYVRIAGPSTNNLFIDNSLGVIKNKLGEQKDNGKIYVRTGIWETFTKWAHSVNLTPFVAINDGERTRIGGKWDTKTALRILAATERVSDGEVVWQLGYECKNQTLAEYLETLNSLKILVDAYPSRKKGFWRLVGSDISKCLDPKDSEGFKNYLLESNKILDAIFISGFGSLQVFDNLSDGNKMEVVDEFVRSNASLWYSLKARGNYMYMEEDDKAIMWVNDLGTAAVNGINVLFKEMKIEDIVEPTMSYYASVLHKKLVGQRVLGVQMSALDLLGNANVTMYAHCASLLGRPVAGAVTLFGTNPNNKPSKVSIMMSGKESAGEVMQFILTMNKHGHILVNGAQMTYEGDLHPIVKKLKPFTTLTVQIPAKSVGFWVIANAKLQACNYYDDVEIVPLKNDNSNDEIQQKDEIAQKLQEILLNELKKSDNRVKRSSVGHALPILNRTHRDKRTVNDIPTIETIKKIMTRSRNQKVYDKLNIEDKRDKRDKLHSILEELAELMGLCEKSKNDELAMLSQIFKSRTIEILCMYTDIEKEEIENILKNIRTNVVLPTRSKRDLNATFSDDINKTQNKQNQDMEIKNASSVNLLSDNKKKGNPFDLFDSKQSIKELEDDENFTTTTPFSLIQNSSDHTDRYFVGLPENKGTASELLTSNTGEEINDANYKKQIENDKKLTSSLVETLTHTSPKAASISKNNLNIENIPTSKESGIEISPKIENYKIKSPKEDILKMDDKTSIHNIGFVDDKVQYNIKKNEKIEERAEKITTAPKVEINYGKMQNLAKTNTNDTHDASDIRVFQNESEKLLPNLKILSLPQNILLNTAKKDFLKNGSHLHGKIPTLAADIRNLKPQFHNNANIFDKILNIPKIHTDNLNQDLSKSGAFKSDGEKLELGKTHSVENFLTNNTFLAKSTEEQVLESDDNIITQNIEKKGETFSNDVDDQNKYFEPLASETNINKNEKLPTTTGNVQKLEPKLLNDNVNVVHNMMRTSKTNLTNINPKHDLSNVEEIKIDSEKLELGSEHGIRKPSTPKSFSKTPAGKEPLKSDDSENVHSIANNVEMYIKNIEETEYSEPLASASNTNINEKMPIGNVPVSDLQLPRNYDWNYQNINTNNQKQDLFNAGVSKFDSKKILHNNALGIKFPSKLENLSVNSTKMNILNKNNVYSKIPTITGNLRKSEPDLSNTKNTNFDKILNIPKNIKHNQIHNLSKTRVFKLDSEKLELDKTRGVKNLPSLDIPALNIPKKNILNNKNLFNNISKLIENTRTSEPNLRNNNNNLIDKIFNIPKSIANNRKFDFPNSEVFQFDSKKLKLDNDSGIKFPPRLRNLSLISKKNNDLNNNHLFNKMPTLTENIRTSTFKLPKNDNNVFVNVPKSNNKNQNNDLFNTDVFAFNNKKLKLENVGGVKIPSKIVEISEKSAEEEVFKKGNEINIANEVETYIKQLNDQTKYSQPLTSASTISINKKMPTDILKVSEPLNSRNNDNILDETSKEPLSYTNNIKQDNNTLKSKIFKLEIEKPKFDKARALKIPPTLKKLSLNTVKQNILNNKFSTVSENTRTLKPLLSKNINNTFGTILNLPKKNTNDITQNLQGILKIDNEKSKIDKNRDVKISSTLIKYKPSTRNKEILITDNEQSTVQDTNDDKRKPVVEKIDETNKYIEPVAAGSTDNVREEKIPTLLPKYQESQLSIPRYKATNDDDLNQLQQSNLGNLKTIELKENNVKSLLDEFGSLRNRNIRKEHNVPDLKQTFKLDTSKKLLSNIKGTVFPKTNALKIELKKTNSPNIQDKINNFQEKTQVDLNIKKLFEKDLEKLKSEINSKQNVQQTQIKNIPLEIKKYKIPEILLDNSEILNSDLKFHNNAKKYNSENMKLQIKNIKSQYKGLIIPEIIKPKVKLNKDTILEKMLKSNEENKANTVNLKENNINEIKFPKIKIPNYEFKIPKIDTSELTKTIKLADLKDNSANIKQNETNHYSKYFRNIPLTETNESLKEKKNSETKTLEIKPKRDEPVLLSNTKFKKLRDLDVLGTSLQTTATKNIKKDTTDQVISQTLKGIDTDLNKLILNLKPKTPTLTTLPNIANDVKKTTVPRSLVEERAKFAIVKIPDLKSLQQQVEKIQLNQASKALDTKANETFKLPRMATNAFTKTPNLLNLKETKSGTDYIERKEPKFYLEDLKNAQLVSNKAVKNIQIPELKSFRPKIDKKIEYSDTRLKDFKDMQVLQTTMNRVTRKDAKEQAEQEILPRVSNSNGKEFISDLKTKRDVLKTASRVADVVKKTNLPEIKPLRIEKEQVVIDKKSELNAIQLRLEELRTRQQSKAQLPKIIASSDAKINTNIKLPNVNLKSILNDKQKSNTGVGKVKTSIGNIEVVKNSIKRLTDNNVIKKNTVELAKVNNELSVDQKLLKYQEDFRKRLVDLREGKNMRQKRENVRNAKQKREIRFEEKGVYEEESKLLSRIQGENIAENKNTKYVVRSPRRRRSPKYKYGKSVNSLIDSNEINVLNTDEKLVGLEKKRVSQKTKNLNYGYEQDVKRLEVDKKTSFKPQNNTDTASETEDTNKQDVVKSNNKRNAENTQTNYDIKTNKYLSSIRQIFQPIIDLSQKIKTMWNNLVKN